MENRALTSFFLGQTRQLCALVAVAIYLGTGACKADDRSSFHRFSGAHIELITDVEPTPDVRELAAVFDKGVEQWSDLFRVEHKKVADWKVEAYIMTDRQRFENAGLISPNVRTFREGHQEGDLILCKEQPSAYYRRHLLLHEGVHWFMEKALGGYGPGWWMEGIAEWQSTHRWDGKTLVCGVMPSSREDFPYWGRLRWVQQDLQSGQAPSLAVLFRRAKDLHRVDSTYGWSWMAATFFANHPRYKDKFMKRLTEPTDFSDALNREVLAWIGADMQIVQSEFNGFVSEMDYGVVPSSVIVDLKEFSVKGSSSTETIEISPRKFWQLTPTRLVGGKEYHFSADGKISLEVNDTELPSEPEGLTLRYVRSHPVGQLIGVLIPQAVSLENTVTWQRIRLGRSATIKPEENSWIVMRVNRENADTGESQGSYRVSITGH